MNLRTAYCSALLMVGSVACSGADRSLDPPVATGGGLGTGGKGASSGGAFLTGGANTGASASGGNTSGGNAPAAGGAGVGGSSSGGARASGGTSSGGTAVGGAAVGGTRVGGSSSGGASGGSGATGGSNQTSGGTTLTGGTSSAGGASSAGGSPSGGQSTPGGRASAGGSASGGVASGGTASGGAATGGTASGGTATGGTSGGCDAGTTTTTWASNCPTAPPTTCTAGSWLAGGPDPDHSGFKLLSESTHFAVYSDESPSGAQAAVDYLETVWSTYFGDPMYMREPLCSSSTKYKASVHVHSDWGLTGGAWTANRMGMWIGTGGLADHWGLAHEFMHGVQSVQGGMSCNSTNTCGWVYESHANFAPHQVKEYANNMHCSEMMANAPHLYLGSTRDRYCNWQFMEYLKDKYCHSAVNAIWTSTGAPDPFTNIMKGQGWNISQLNDFFGEWAMHNVTWDYKASGAAMRSTYGAITDKSRAERRLRLTSLEPLDSSWATNRRFQSPYFWAPQRWGYNVVRLVPDSGATAVTVTFRGVTQSGANSDWRWGLVAVNGTTPRYGSMMAGADGQVNFCINSGESLYLVVVGTPSVQQTIVWDQAYGTIYRYPYMVELGGAWPDGFQGGTQAACPSGTTRVSNGGGCGPSSLASSVYVGPYAQVLGGTVSGSARIEDHATVLSGTVSGGTVGALSVLSGFGVSGTAKAQATFYPLGFFESGQAISGSTVLYGDVEYRGQGYNRSSGSCAGFVDSATCVAPGNEVTTAPPYSWRP